MCIFFKKTFLLHLPGRFANAFCLNIHTWAFEPDSCEERQSLRAPAEAALRCDPRHNGGTDTGGCPVLPPVASQSLLTPEHTCPHTYGYTATHRLPRSLASDKISKPNTGNHPLPIYFNHISVLCLPKVAAEDESQWWNVVGLGIGIFSCPVTH